MMSEQRIAADFAAMGGDAPAPTPTPVPEPVETDTAAVPFPQPPTDLPPAPEPESPPPPQTRADDRIHELTAARRAERQRADAAEAQAKELRAALERVNATLEKLAPQPSEAAQPAELPRPRREDFVDPDAYEAARDDWLETRATSRALAQFQERDAERRRTETAAEEQRRQQERQQQIGQGYQARRTEFMKEHGDYVEVAESEATPASGPMLQVILTNANGPAIAYWLGQHREEATRIANLADPAEQVLELGMIAAALRNAGANGSGTAPAPARPAPIQPVRTVASAAPRSINDMSMEEMDKMYRDEQTARAKSGGRY